MPDDALRLQAELTDKFSGPLKAFRNQILGLSREGPEHLETVTKSFGKVEGALVSTARSAQVVLNPALAALGVTGLTAGVAVSGIVSALQNLSGNLASLGQLSRDTGIAAKTLQEFSGVAGRFNITQDQVAQGAQNFADKMRLFSRGQGDLWRWTLNQGTNAASRQAFQTFAEDIARTSDEGEKLKKTLSFMETIKDTREQRIFSQEFFGNADIARLAQGQLGKVEDLFRQYREKMGPLDQESVQRAEQFQRAIADLRGSMKSIGTTIATEVLPFASDFTKWIDDIVKDQRGEFLVELRKALGELSAELRAVNWPAFGRDAKEVLVSTTGLVRSLAQGLHDVVETVQFLRKGEYWQALRGSGPDAASGWLARRAAPRVGDDELEAAQEVELLRKQMKAPAVDPESGMPIDPFGLQDGEKRKQLEAAEARLKALQARTPEQRQKDFEASERLRKSIDNLSETIKQQQGATAQKSSAEGDGDGPFAGARVQSAALRSGGSRFGGGYGGGSGPGYSGEQGEAGLAGRSFGGGRFNGLGGGRPRVPGMGGGARVPGVGDESSPVAPFGKRDATFEGKAPEVMRRLMKDFDLSSEEAAVVLGNLGHESAGFRAFKEGRGGPGRGWAQWTEPGRKRRFFEYAQRHGLDPRSDEANYGFLKWELEHTHKNAIQNLKRAQGPQAKMYAFERDFEGAGVKAYGSRFDYMRRAQRAFDRSGGQGGAAQAEQGDFLPNGAPRILKPDSMKDAPGLTMEDADRLRALRQSAGRRPEVLADPNDERRKPMSDGFWTEEDRRATRDLGVALRDMRRRAEERQRESQISAGRLDAAAGRAGVVGGNLTANGVVNVQVNKAGPDATVRTETKGNLFGDVATVNGRQMRKAD